jgi:hypothetical protein
MVCGPWLVLHMGLVHLNTQAEDGFLQMNIGILQSCFFLSLPTGLISVWSGTLTTAGIPLRLMCNSASEPPLKEELYFCMESSLLLTALLPTIKLNFKCILYHLGQV